MTAPSFGPWIPAPAARTWPGWDCVKVLRLKAEPCPQVEGLAAVNAWANQLVEYRQSERWQGPGMTLLTACGDCKDIAVLKRAALIAKGYAEDALLLVIGQDIEARQLHAVLQVGGHVLDSKADALLEPADLAHWFSPELAFTEAQSFVYERERQP